MVISEHQHYGNELKTVGEAFGPHVRCLNSLIKSATLVNLNDQTFNFLPTTFKDVKFDTQAQLKGKIYHNNFQNWGFDFNIMTDRILMLNINENDDSVFFGDGFLGGEINLYGPSKNLSIDVVGSTMEGTNIKIPWSKDSIICASIESIFKPFSSSPVMLSGNRIMNKKIE